METRRLSVEELALEAGLSRRAIRFYVQRGLIRPPDGRGRGKHYDAKHLEELRRIRDLQSAGHSLDAIRKILHAGTAPPVDPARVSVAGPRRRPSLSAKLWTRLVIADGVELHLDATKHNPDVKDLLAIQQAIKELIG